MSLLIPNYPAPTAADPLPAAVGWFRRITLDFENDHQEYILKINQDAAAATANRAKVDDLYYVGGNWLVDPTLDASGQPVPGTGVRLPLLSEMLAADAGFAAAFATVRSKLYAAILPDPRLAGATDLGD